jgi:hypothetical protein
MDNYLASGLEKSTLGILENYKKYTFTTSQLNKDFDLSYKKILV